jgi:uncharacterized protein YoxC
MNRDAEELAQIVAAAMRDFRVGMEAQQQLAVRIGARTSQVIRYGMLGLSVFGCLIFFLVYVLMKDMREVVTTMREMSGYMASIEAETAHLSKRVGGIHDNMRVMTATMQALPQMNDDLSGMNTHVGEIARAVSGMNGSVAAMQADIRHLNGQIGMGYNVIQMSKPMKMMPFP